MMPQLTLVGSNFPPSVNPCVVSFPHDCDKPGVDVEYVMLALKSAGFLNFNFLLVGNTSEIITAILNRQADITMQPIEAPMIDSANLKELLLLRYFVDSSMIMLTKPPAETSSVPEQFLILRILQWPVWVLLLLSYMAIRAIGEAYKRYHLNTSKRALYVAYALFLTIFTGAIGNFLAIALAKPVLPKKLFNNFDELLPRLDDQTCKLVVMFDTNADDDNSSLQVLPRTIKRLKSFNPVIVLPDNDQNAFAKHILDSRTCEVGITVSSLFLGGGKESCSLDIIPDSKLSTENLQFYILLRKDHAYAEEIESTFMLFGDQTQQKKKINKKYQKYVCSPRLDDGSSGEPSALTIMQMQDSFVLLVIGVTLAGAAKTIEFLLARHA